jgi:uridine kinase
MVRVNDIPSLTQQVIDAFYLHDKQTAFTVAISGIDASGKGYSAKLLQQELEKKGFKVANINIDPWQNPLPIRLQEVNAAENFYNNVFRWKDVFSELLIPLKKSKSIYLPVSLIRSDADEYYEHIYDYREIDILLIDAILLFQERFISFYHYKIWIECSFETGLKRAVTRNVENLDEARLIHDYNTYYYPAQKFHFRIDNPVAYADIIYDNN